MSKNFLQKVIVTLVTVALLCTAFAITSFAALSIEGGKLTGKEEGTYTANQVLSINSKGTALTYSTTAVTLDGTENLTAGLWKVTCPDNTTIILYSEGSATDRSALGVVSSGTTLSASNNVNQFVVGRWTTPKNSTNSNAKNQVLFNIAESNYGLRPNSAYAHLGADVGNKELGKLYTAQTNYKNDPSEANETELLTAQTTVINKFNSTYNTWYAYEPSEMIPANEVLSFTYKMGFFGSNTGFYYSGDDVYTKVELLTATASGGVKTYTWTVKRTDGFLKNNNKANTQTIKIDFTKNYDGDNPLPLPADEYVVAMKVHPYVGMENGKTTPGLATASTATTEWATTFYPNPSGYEIYVQPVDISKLVYTDGTVTVPKDNFGSVYQIAQVTGIASDGEGLSYGEFTDMTLSGDNYTKSGLTAGLWAIKGKSTSADRVDSDPVLVYVAGSPSDRKRLGTYSTGNTLNTTTEVNKLIPGIWTGPDGNAKNNVSSNASWSAMWNIALDGDFTIRPSAQYSHFSASTADLARHDGTLITLYNAQTAYEADKSAANEAALLAAQAAIIERLNNRYYAVYSYTSEEIIPANEVFGFTYEVGIFGNNTGLDYTGDDVKSKAVIYTTDKYGNISEYTWTIDLDSFLEAKSGATKTISFDFTESNTLPADEYVVAMELHPFVGMEKGNTTPGLVKATAAEISWSTKLVLDPAEYEIAIPKLSTPEEEVDFTIADGVVTIKTTDSYKYASADADGNFDPDDLEAVVSGVTELTAGYWVIVKASTDANYADSDPYFLTLVGQAPAPAISIDKNGNFVLNTEAEGYNAEFEYEFLIKTADTDLNNLDSYTWTAFNPVGAKAQEAGETYLVRVKAAANDIWTASAPTETKSPAAIILGAKLILDDGRIGVKILADAKTEKVNGVHGGYTKDKDPYMSMSFSGGRFTPMNGTFNKDNNYTRWTFFNNSFQADWTQGRFACDEDGHCYYTVYVSAKDYNTTKVTINEWRPQADKDTNGCWPTGSVPSNVTITVKKYIDTYKELAAADPATYGAALTLVEKLEAYCMNAANYFDAEAPALEEVTPVDKDITTPTDQKNAVGTLPAGIEFYGTSLMLEDRTQIRYYFTVEKSAYTVNGEDGSITFNVEPEAGYNTSKLISDNVIFYESSPIPAHQLGESVVKTFVAADESSFTVTYSPLNYIAEAYGKNAKTTNLVTSLYNYYRAAYELLNK